MILVPLDAIAYQNALRSLPPGEKVIFALGLGILSYFLVGWGQILLILWLSGWIIIYARIPWRFYGQLLTLPCGFLSLSCPALLFTIQIAPARMSTPVIWSSQWGIFQVSILPENLILVREMSLRAIAITVCIYFLLLTTPFIELLQILKKLKCPPLIIELLGLMYRFIFILLTTMTELITAQQARLGYRNRATTWHSVKIIGGTLLKRSLEHYRSFSLGLTSRGFTGQLQFLPSSSHRGQWRYRLEAIAGYIVLLCLGIQEHGPTI